MTPPTQVPVEGWTAALAQARERGLTYLSQLTAIDRIEEIEVVVHLSTPDAAEQVLLSTSVPARAPRLPSAVPVYPGADWHEREAAEMLGVKFTGHPDPRPLLLRVPAARPPLRRTTPLTARMDAPWPGATDPEASGRRSSRRPARPPGVLDSWQVDGSTSGGSPGGTSGDES